MSRNFDDGSSEYLSNGSPPVTTYPFTLSCWGRSDDATAAQCAISIGDTDTDINWFQIMFAGHIAGDYIRFTALDGSAGLAITTTGYSINTWHHVAGVATDSTDRAVFIDGGSKGTNNDDISPAGVDSVGIGGLVRNTPAAFFSGDVAEAAIWDTNLSDAEILSLSKGYSPLFIRPQNLVLYVPLIRDNDEDLIGGLSFSVGGTPGISAHPPIIHPATTILGVPIVAGGAVMAAIYYRNLLSGDRL